VEAPIFVPAFLVANKLTGIGYFASCRLIRRRHLSIRSRNRLIIAYQVVLSVVMPTKVVPGTQQKGRHRCAAKFGEETSRKQHSKLLLRSLLAPVRVPGKHRNIRMRWKKQSMLK